jgi:hypothetical protein
MDTAGNLSEWSAVWHVTVESAANTAPLLNRFTSGSPVLTWNAVSWAQGYEVVISTNAAFSGLPLWSDSSLNGVATSLTLPTNLANGVYYWRIRARSGPNSWGTWSTTGTFVIEA